MTNASQNRDAWEIGLAGLPNAQEARNVILSDDKVREFVAAAYGIDDKFGLLTDTLAVTGARPSQAVRLRVEDLHDHPVRPKLMMPKSAKGGDRNRAEKKLERYSVPITVQLAARLRAAARAPGRPCAAAAAKRRQPLARQSWRKLSSRGQEDRHRHRRRSRCDDVRAPAFVDRADAAEKRADQAGGSRCTTHRPRMIEKHYARYITEHSDDVSRHALLQHAIASRRECRRAGRVSKFTGH